MSKNILKDLIDISSKLYRENYQKNNNKFSEKIINFSLKNSGNFNKKFIFNSTGDFVEIIIKIKSDNLVDFDVIFNDVLIEKCKVEKSGEYAYCLYSKGENLLNLNILSDETDFYQFLVLVKGDVENCEKSLSKLLNLNNNFYLQNAENVTQTNDIMTITSIYTNNMHNNYGIYIDTNYQFDKISLSKNNIFHIYYDNGLKLKNLNDGIDYGLNINTDIACIIPSVIDSKNINIFYDENGVLKVSSFNEEMVLTNTNKLSEFNGEKIVKLSSIISDKIVDYFLVKNTYDLWSFVRYDFNENKVLKVVPFDRCDDLKVYYEDENIVCIEKVVNGVLIKKYNNFYLSNKIYEKEFLNVNDAFYFDGNIHLVNQDNIQLVEV